MREDLFSRITGTGAAFPRRRLTNEALAAELAAKGEETSDEWIVARTGIRERRISTPGDEEELNSALGARASLSALEMAEKEPRDVDAILYATCTPDTILPSTACWLQKKIGAENAWALDVNAACSGFVYALSTADKFIRCGEAQTILVVGSDVLSAFTNWDDRSTCVVFGDASGAVVLESAGAETSSRILSSHLHADGRLWNLFHVPAGGSAQEVTPEQYEMRANKMHMKGREIFKIAVKKLGDYAIHALEENGLGMDELDWLIPHQANQRIIEATARRIGFPMDKVILNIDRFGNTSAATVPTAFDEAVRDGRIQRGHLVLLDAFGAGLTQGAVLLRF